MSDQDQDNNGAEGTPPSPPAPPPAPPPPPAFEPPGQGGGQFVVPDPTAPSEGEATTFVPPTPPMAPPPQPQAPPSAMPPPGAFPPPAPGGQTPSAPSQMPPPSSGPPTQAWNQPPVAQPASPPLGGVPQPPGAPPPQGGAWGAPPQAPGSWGAQQVPGAPGMAPSYAQAPAPKKKRGLGLVVIIIVVCVIVVGGIVGAILLLTDLGGSSIENAEIDRCVIEADGTMAAAGRVEAEDSVTLEVVFEDADSGKELDKTTVTTVRGPRGRQGWIAEGKTDDEAVKKITCVLSSAE